VHRVERRLLLAGDRVREPHETGEAIAVDGLDRGERVVPARATPHATTITPIRARVWSGRMHRMLRVAIVGGGIGGLAAGAALRRDGHSVTIFERSDRFEPLGAGLSVWPNGAHALRALGLGDVVDSAGIPRGDGGIRRARDGALLAASSAEELERRYGAPLALVHRADLQSALLAAVGEDSVRFGADVVAADEQGTVELASGETVSADVVVGADGIRSTVRRGDEPPRPSGIVAYRSVVEWPADVPSGEYWGRGEVIGLAPLSEGRVYWYAAHRTDDAAADPGAQLAALRARYGAWAAPIPGVLGATDPERLLRHELSDRPPADDWGRGAVTLLGDAAHPMLPFLGQGACCALEDAVALAGALRAAGDVREALRSYERARARRAAQLVKGSRGAARVALTASPVGTRLRDLAMSAVPSRMRLRQFDRVIGTTPR
jgi:2-polyprenyl-6-methoxyphenol hydroxylase-like FAD-dependent oxidoreductase